MFDLKDVANGLNCRPLLSFHQIPYIPLQAHVSAGRFCVPVDPRISLKATVLVASGRAQEKIFRKKPASPREYMNTSMQRSFDFKANWEKIHAGLCTMVRVCQGVASPDEKITTKEYQDLYLYPLQQRVHTLTKLLILCFLNFEATCILGVPDLKRKRSKNFTTRWPPYFKRW